MEGKLISKYLCCTFNVQDEILYVVIPKILCKMCLLGQQIQNLHPMISYKFHDIISGREWVSNVGVCENAFSQTSDGCQRH